MTTLHIKRICLPSLCNRFKLCNIWVVASVVQVFVDPVGGRLRWTRVMVASAAVLLFAYVVLVGSELISSPWLPGFALPGLSGGHDRPASAPAPAQPVQGAPYTSGPRVVAPLSPSPAPAAAPSPAAAAPPAAQSAPPAPQPSLVAITGPTASPSLRATAHPSGIASSTPTQSPTHVPSAVSQNDVSTPAAVQPASRDLGSTASNSSQGGNTNPSRDANNGQGVPALGQPTGNSHTLLPTHNGGGGNAQGSGISRVGGDAQTSSSALGRSTSQGGSSLQAALRQSSDSVRNSVSTAVTNTANGLHSVHLQSGSQGTQG